MADVTSIRIPSDVLHKLDVLAMMNEVNRSQVIIRAIRELLKREVK